MIVEMLRLGAEVQIPPFATVLLLVGAVLILVALAGKITIKEAHLGISRASLRCAAGVIGGVFVIASVWLFLAPPLSPEDRAKLTQGVVDYPTVRFKVREEQPKQSETEVQQRSYDELAKLLGVDPKLLQEKLPQFAQELKRAPNASTYERASAAYVTKDYAEAERLALTAADEAQRATPPRLTDMIKAFELAGNSADAQFE